MIRIDQDGPVAVVVMDRPKVNALSPELVVALEEAFETVFSDPTVGAVVLASDRPGLFSAGFDLVALGALEGEAFVQFFDRFARLYHRIHGGPVPVVAAVDGHALAGGAILVLACERRVFGRGTWGWGLTEVDLGLSLPGGVVEMLRRAVSPGALYETTALGKIFSPEETARMGLTHRLVDEGTALGVAREEARALAEKPREVLAAIRKTVRADEAHAVAEADGGVGAEFHRWWTAPECEDRRRAILERLHKKG